MSDMLRVIRIFLASPGDVSEERAQARYLIKDDLSTLPFIQDEVSLRIIAWEDPTSRAPMPATLSPQRAIALNLPKPSECDIAVIVFWSRMGTPLDEERHGLKDGKRPYWSGTEWEFEDALKASEAAGKPIVLIYRRTADVPLNPTWHDFDERVQQLKKVEEFFAEFRDLATGAWLRSYTEYETPEQFGELLKHDLMVCIKQLMEAPTKPAKEAVIEPAKPVWPTGKSPFPGLRAFTPDDKPIFFGRGRETDALLKRVNEQRFVAVVGASGSGKSSLVGAGLIPRLADNAIPGSKDWLLPHLQGPDDHREWVGLRFTPGELSDNPFTTLAIRLVPLLKEANSRELADTLAADSSALCAICEQALAEQPDWAELLLFIDQFEELFTVVRPEYRAPFIDLLACAATTNRLRTVLTVRADFYHRCVEYSRLAELLREGSFPLAAPELDALLEMIERPAVLAGLQFDQGLPGRILRETGQEPGALALLAYTLDELYQQAEDKYLNYATYEVLGGVQGAIGTRAEAIFAKLISEAQDMMPYVFRELVEVDEYGTATRQRAPLARFGENDAAWILLERFTDARLLITGTRGNTAFVEVAHEALFRNWPRLKTWIDDTQADLFLLRQVRQAVRAWKKKHRSDDFLWTGRRLREAQAMVKRINPRLSADEQVFLRSEVNRLEGKLKNPDLDHAARALIGERLHIIGDTRLGVGLRADGLPDIVWCLVPEGRIVLEKNAKSPSIVDAFFIAKYLITNIQFQAFLQDVDGYNSDRWWHQSPHPKMEHQRFEFSNYPRDSVNWYQAVAFCKWLNVKLPPDGWPGAIQAEMQAYGEAENMLSTSKTRAWQIRLPTEWEWQQAATGGNPDNTYPWGPNWERGRCNTKESGLSRSTAVGMYPHGVSPVGALDMSGNVREWCQNVYSDWTSGPVLRGGSWYFAKEYARTTSRARNSPDARPSHYGFRIVCSTFLP